MSLKILGGKLKGHTLKVLPTDKLRPTSVILRRKFFDRFQDWEGIAFYDLFAGTGSVGIEAFSRGAKKIYLNELHRKTFNFLKDNVGVIQEKFNTTDLEMTLSCEAGEKLFDRLLLENDPEQTKCLFIDPPYHLTAVYQHFYKSLTSINTNSELFIVIEGDKNAEFKYNAWQESFPHGQYLWHGDHYLFMFWAGES